MDSNQAGRSTHNSTMDHAETLCLSIRDEGMLSQTNRDVFLLLLVVFAGVCCVAALVLFWKSVAASGEDDDTKQPVDDVVKKESTTVSTPCDDDDEKRQTEPANNGGVPFSPIRPKRSISAPPSHYRYARKFATEENDNIGWETMVVRDTPFKKRKGEQHKYEKFSPRC